MKLSCNVIRDLLPLYRDGVCADETRALVEEHLEDCASCRAELAALDAPLTQTAEEQREVRALDNVAKTWRRGKLRAFLKGCAVTALLCTVLLGLFSALVGWHGAVPYDLSQMQVYDRCVLPDGRIAYRLDYPGDRYMEYRFAEGKNGEKYKIPCHSVTGLGEPDSRDWQSGDWHIYDWEEENVLRVKNGTQPTTAYYWGEGDNAVLIWQQGMDLPRATDAQLAEIAARFGIADTRRSPAAEAAAAAGVVVTDYPTPDELLDYIPYYLDENYPDWREK